MIFNHKDIAITFAYRIYVFNIYLYTELWLVFLFVYI